MGGDNAATLQLLIRKVILDKEDETGKPKGTKVITSFKKF